MCNALSVIGKSIAPASMMKTRSFDKNNALQPDETSYGRCRSRVKGWSGDPDYEYKQITVPKKEVASSAKRLPRVSEKYRGVTGTTLASFLGCPLVALILDLECCTLSRTYVILCCARLILYHLPPCPWGRPLHA